MSPEQRIAALVAGGWRVFAEWSHEGAEMYVHVGLTKNASLGIEGPSYCDYTVVAPTIGEALDRLVGMIASGSQG